MQELVEARAAEGRGRGAIERVRHALARPHVAVDGRGDGSVDGGVHDAQLVHPRGAEVAQHAVAEHRVLEHDLGQIEALVEALERVALGRLGGKVRLGAARDVLDDVGDAGHEVGDVIEQRGVLELPRARQSPHVLRPVLEDLAAVLAHESAELRRVDAMLLRCRRVHSVPKHGAEELEMPYLDVPRAGQVSR